MTINQYFLRMAELKRHYLGEGTIDSQFIQLDEDEDNGELLEEVVDDYFEASSEILNTIEDELRKAIPNFSVIDRELQRFKASSLSIGAPKVTLGITQMQEYLRRGNLIFLKIAFEFLKEKADIFESKIVEYMDIREQTIPEEMTDDEYEFDNDDSE